MSAIMRMIGGFAVLVGLLWIGGRLASLLPIPLPGALVGMVLLAGVLILRPAAPVVLAGEILLRRYALFFVPAGVGVMTQLAALHGNITALAAALVGSSVLALGVTALTMHALLTLQSRRNARPKDAICHE